MPTQPSVTVDYEALKKAADDFSGALHKASLGEGDRPAIIGAFITALWFEKQGKNKGTAGTAPELIVGDVKSKCVEAFKSVGKEAMGAILVVKLDELGATDKGRAAAVAIYTRLKELCPDQIDADFIGLLYQNFFSYTGASELLSTASLLTPLFSLSPQRSGPVLHAALAGAPRICVLPSMPTCRSVLLCPPDRLHGARGARQDGLQGVRPVLRHRRPPAGGCARGAALVLDRGRAA